MLRLTRDIRFSYLWSRGYDLPGRRSVYFHRGILYKLIGLKSFIIAKVPMRRHVGTDHQIRGGLRFGDQ